MPKTKPAKDPANKAAEPVRFSLVPESAQQKMYSALQQLQAAEAPRSGAEVAEIAAVCALGAHDAVQLACTGHGARLLGRGTEPREGGILGATISAIEHLLGDQQASALLCAGAVEKLPPEELRQALRFAGRHKLPILFLVANTLTPGRRQAHDLRTLHAEFGLPVFSVDAADAVAVYRVATEALHNARRQRGGAVIEAVTILGRQQSTATPLEMLHAYMERHGTRPL